jgi:sulfur carrier protein
MRVIVNGTERELPADATLAEAVAATGAGPQERGLAVALDAEVVPRERWATTPLAPGARIEVVRASAGG